MSYRWKALKGMKAPDSKVGASPSTLFQFCSSGRVRGAPKGFDFIRSLRLIDSAARSPLFHSSNLSSFLPDYRLPMFIGNVDPWIYHAIRAMVKFRHIFLVLDRSRIVLHFGRKRRHYIVYQMLQVKEIATNIVTNNLIKRVQGFIVHAWFTQPMANFD